MLLQDSQVVFLSGNRFAVHDFRIDSPWSTPDDPTPRSQGEGEEESGTGEGVLGFPSITRTDLQQASSSERWFRLGCSENLVG